MSASSSPNIVEDGLVLCLDAGDPKSYPMDGTTFTDRANGNNGTLHGATFSPSNAGALDFDGTNDYVACGNTSDLRFIHSDPFSLEAWVNADSYSGFHHIIGKTFGNYRLAVTSAGYSFRLDQNAIATSSGSPVAGVWQHVVATWEPSSVAKVYVNAVLQTTSNTQLDWTNTDASFNLGNSHGESYFFNGKIAVGRAYNKTLTLAEIKQNFNALRGRFGV